MKPDFQSLSYSESTAQTSIDHFRINDLPIDIVLEVFVHMCIGQMDDDEDLDGCRGARLISSVSHSWHSMALQEPRLWARVRFRIPGKNVEKGLRQFDRNLERSKNAPLHLNLIFTYSSTPELRRHVKEISVPHLHRCYFFQFADHAFNLPHEWVPFPNELQSVKNVNLLLLSPHHFGPGIVDLRLPKRLHSFTFHAPYSDVPIFGTDSEIQHMKLLLNADFQAAGLLDAAKRSRMLDYALFDHPRLENPNIYSHSLPLLETLVISKSTFPFTVSPQLKYLTCDRFQSLFPSSSEHSELSPATKDVLRGLITLKVKTRVPTWVCDRGLSYCEALERLSIPAWESTKVIAFLLKTSDDRSTSTFDVNHQSSTLDTPSHNNFVPMPRYCRHLQHLHLLVNPLQDHDLLQEICEFILRLLTARPRISTVEFIMAHNLPEWHPDLLDVLVLVQNLRNEFPTRVILGISQVLED